MNNNVDLEIIRGIMQEYRFGDTTLEVGNSRILSLFRTRFINTCKCEFPRTFLFSQEFCEECKSYINYEN